MSEKLRQLALKRTRDAEIAKDQGNLVLATVHIRDAIAAMRNFEKQGLFARASDNVPAMPKDIRKKI